jgi:hypothetical protein
MLVAWLALVTALVTHRPLPPREDPPAWYVRICAEVSTC